MEFRIGLYRWLKLCWLTGSRYSILSAYVFMLLLFRTLAEANPESSILPNVNAGMLRIVARLLLAFWPWSGVLVCDPPVGERSGRHLVALLPVSTRRRQWTAAAGRGAAVGVAVALALALELIAFLIEGPRQPLAATLAEPTAWALAAVPILGFIWLARWGHEAVVRRSGTPLALHVWYWILIAGGAAGVVTYLHVRSVWQLAASFGVGAGLYGALIGLAVLWPRGRGGDARGCLRRARLRLRPAFHPELGFGRWGRAAALALSTQALAIPLVIIAYAALGRCTIGWSSEWRTAFSVSALDLQRLATICFALAPVAALLLCARLWDVPPTPNGGRGKWSVPVRELLPITPQCRWRRRLAAALLFGCGGALVGELFGGVGWILARTAGEEALPLADLHWLALAAPALGVMLWALGPLLRYPLKIVLSFPRDEVWIIPAAAVVVVELTLVGLVASGALWEWGPLHPSGWRRPYLWPLVCWALAAVVLLVSYYANRPSIWWREAHGYRVLDPEPKSGGAFGLALVVLLPLCVGVAGALQAVFRACREAF